MLSYITVVKESGSLDLSPEIQARLRPGQQVEIHIRDSAPEGESSSSPNRELLALLREMDAVRETMAETSPLETDRFIRQARSGGLDDG